MPSCWNRGPHLEDAPAIGHPPASSRAGRYHGPLRLRSFIPAVALLTSGLFPAPALAADDDVAWRWRKFGTADAALAATFAFGAVVDRLTPNPNHIRWEAGWAVDAGFRDAVVLGRTDARTAAARASDVTVGLLTAQPFADAAIAGFVYGEPETAWQITAISFAAIMANAATTGVVKRITGRARPIQTACDADPSYDETCGARPPRSFYSGHASSAFTVASLTCMHHAHLPLYGRGWDELACVTAVLAAGTVAYERVISDRHYLSDVVAGAAMGTLSGALVPWLLYYRLDGSDRRWIATPRISQSELGLAALAVW